MVMSKGTYLSENLTPRQIDLMLLLQDHELDIFTLDEVQTLLGDQVEELPALLENLTDKRILNRIERGKYCRYGFRDERVIGNYLVSDGAIAYWSALHHYGLTEQFPNSVFVQTTKVKQDKAVFGVYYKFVKIAPYKQMGIIWEGYGNHRYRITSLEKTLADCFDLPRYSGGYAELIRTFREADVRSENLIEACRANRNGSAIRRMGYLAERFRRRDLQGFIRFAKTQVQERYALLDPAGNEEGCFVSSWKLRLNIAEEDLINLVHRQY
jgi:predicted transcriptional regulator of viral defense system